MVTCRKPDRGSRTRKWSSYRCFGPCATILRNADGCGMQGLICSICSRSCPNDRAATTAFGNWVEPCKRLSPGGWGHRLVGRRYRGGRFNTRRIRAISRDLTPLGLGRIRRNLVLRLALTLVLADAPAPIAHTGEAADWLGGDRGEGNRTHAPAQDPGLHAHQDRYTANATGGQGLLWENVRICLGLGGIDLSRPALARSSGDDPKGVLYAIEPIN